MKYKIVTLSFIASVLVSAIFLVYAGDLYYKTSNLAYGVRISIQNSDFEQSNSSIVVKNTFLIENPSPLTFKVTYVREAVYDDSGFQIKLNETYIARFSGSYIALVTGFSNSTISLSVTLDKAPSTRNLFLEVNMRFEDVPILDSLYLARYFVVPLNASSGEGIN